MLFWFEKAVKRDIFRISKGMCPADFADYADEYNRFLFCNICVICG